MITADVSRETFKTGSIRINVSRETLLPNTEPRKDAIKNRFNI